MIKTKYSIGLDIGGTLVKVVEIRSASDAGPRTHALHRLLDDPNDSWTRSIHKVAEDPDSPLTLATLCASTNDFLSALAATPTGSTPLDVGVTGGGALKHKALLEAAQIAPHFIGEIEAVARGWRALSPQTPQPTLMCIVGTGVSLVSVERTGVTRVTGSGIGGATYWGLCKRLTQYTAFADSIAAASSEQSNAGAVDTLVGDIYGGGAEDLGLARELVAGFLGKLADGPCADADIAAAVLRMVVSNVAQIAVQQAGLMGTSCVWFVGGFVAPEAVRAGIEQAVAFWSNGGNVSARFCECGAVLGALGACFAE